MYPEKKKRLLLKCFIQTSQRHKSLGSYFKFLPDNKRGKFSLKDGPILSYSGYNPVTGELGTAVFILQISRKLELETSQSPSISTNLQTLNIPLRMFINVVKDQDMGTKLYLKVNFRVQSANHYTMAFENSEK